MATLGTAGAIAFLSMGGKKAAEDNSPPINAKTKEEESFVKYVQTPTTFNSRDGDGSGGETTTDSILQKLREEGRGREEALNARN